MTDAAPFTPFKTRRLRLAESMRARGGGVAVIVTAPEVPRNRDTDYPYRPDSYFYYLSGFPEPEAVVVIDARGSTPRSILFCRDKNEEREIWDGFRHGPAAAAEVPGGHCQAQCPCQSLRPRGRSAALRPPPGTISSRRRVWVTSPGGPSESPSSAKWGVHIYAPYAKT